MVLEWGMSERFGPIALGGAEEEVFLGEQIAQRRLYSEDTAREADEEIKSILDEAFRKAVDTLAAHRDHLDQLAAELREHEEILGERVLELVKGNIPGKGTHDAESS